MTGKIEDVLLAIVTSVTAVTAQHGGGGVCFGSPFEATVLLYGREGLAAGT